MNLLQNLSNQSSLLWWKQTLRINLQKIYCGHGDKKNSGNVIITYLLDKITHHINLNNVLKRGFPHSEKRFKYYSFLQFKHCVKTSCLNKTFSQVIADETFFIEILAQVNNYYIYHPENVANGEISEFCGPQCHSVYKDHPQEKATNNFLINPADEEVVTEERFERYLKDINDNI